MHEEKENNAYFGKDLEAMSFAENYYNWILDEFRPHINGSIAEVGAGSGNFTSLLLKTDITSLVAFEPSRNMYQYLTKKLASDEKVLAIQSGFNERTEEFSGYFDAIVYVNVLEHIENDKEEIRIIYESMKNGGKLCIFVPALSWLYSRLDKEVGHYRRYYKSGLKHLVEEAGFEVIKIKYFDMLGIIPWYIFFVLFGKTISAGGVSVYDKWVVPIMRRLETAFPPPIGKNLLLIAKKPKD